MGKIDVSRLQHQRYYLYRVNNPGPESTVSYRTSTGGWDEDFNKAMLWNDIDVARSKGVKEFESSASWRAATGTKLSFCVGSVTVEINPYIAQIVATDFLKDKDNV